MTFIFFSCNTYLVVERVTRRKPLAALVPMETLLIAQFNWDSPSYIFEKGKQQYRAYLGFVPEKHLHLAIVERIRSKAWYFRTFEGPDLFEHSDAATMQQVYQQVVDTAEQKFRIAGKDLNSLIESQIH